MKRILIGCEESQIICLEFRKLGFEAYSNDIIDCSGNNPQYHLKMDVFEAVELIKPDLAIFHPPCTLLTIRAQYWNVKYKRDLEKQQSIDFFMRIAELPIKYKAIENPIGIMSKLYRKPDQIIQPYQFGDTEQKATCLWLYNLPLLQPTNIVEPVFYYSKTGRKYSFCDKFWDKKSRSKIRSKTFPGIAKAIAEQWGKYILNN